MNAFTKNTFILLISALLLVGTVSAAQTAPQPSQITQSPNIEQTEMQKQGIFDIFDGLLSLTSSQNTVAPGNSLTFDASATLTQDVDNVNNLIQIVEIYRCDDPDCTDPNPFVEADRKFVDLLGGGGATAGGEWQWSTTYTVPSTESQYEAAAYLYNENTGEVVSDTSVTSFTVQSQTTEPEPDPQPDLRLSRSPSFNVNEEANTVVGSVGIKNIGDGDMTQNDIVEMQVRPYGEGPLSFTSAQQVCDQDYPNNVHVEYSIDSGDSELITLTAGAGLEDGQSYTVYFLTRDGCYPDNEKVDPIYNSYNAGTFTFSEEVSEPSEPQNVVQVSKPELTYEDGTISTTVHFKNKGGDMPDSDIVEMQVRPSGEGPLSFSSTQEVCDSSHPENVHKEYKLSSGESDSTTLSTSAFEEEGSYTVFLLTREGCFPDNEKVEPYYNSVRAGTVDFNSEGEGWVSVVEENALPIALIGLGVLLVVVWFVFLRD